MHATRLATTLLGAAIVALAGCSTPAEQAVSAATSGPAAAAAAPAQTADSVEQDAPPPSGKKVKYSPYPEKNFPNRVYFGDTHLHTAYSTDAGMTGTTLGPEDAYRFARGETVRSSMGIPAKSSTTALCNARWK